MDPLPKRPNVAPTATSIPKSVHRAVRLLGNGTFRLNNLPPSVGEDELRILDGQRCVQVRAWDRESGKPAPGSRWFSPMWDEGVVAPLREDQWIPLLLDKRFSDELSAEVRLSSVGRALLAELGGPAPQPNQRKPGRPRDTDPMKDAKIAAAWETRQYKTFAELATALSMTATHVKLAVGRHRKRSSSPDDYSGAENTP